MPIPRRGRTSGPAIHAIYNDAYIVTLRNPHRHGLAGNVLAPPINPALRRLYPVLIVSVSRMFEHQLVEKQIWFNFPVKTAPSSQSPNLRQSETVSDKVLILVGAFDEFHLDSGALSAMKKDDQGLWYYDLMTELSPFFQVRIQRANESNESGLSQELGALHNRTVPGQLLPLPLLEITINIDGYPSPNLAYRITVNDTDQQYYLSPVGSWQNQVAIFFLLGAVPVLTGFASIRVYLYAFYAVRVNKSGKTRKEIVLPTIQSKMRFNHCSSEISLEVSRQYIKSLTSLGRSSAKRSKSISSPRRTILIATIEYEIDDWNIRIDSGDLGVMAQLMSNVLEDEDPVWVIPCAHGNAYPEDQRANPMTVVIFGSPQIVQVQHHQLRNIDFVLLDAPVFWAQTKAAPYPRRMNDIDNAIYYSSRNFCIAEVIRRPPAGLYHINDFHGAVAPLHLPPRFIPSCLSRHNGELQGSWRVRTPREIVELCRIYNLELEFVRKHVQFGEVFNVLQAGASCICVWQNGFGIVGVSKKHSTRSFIRHPVFCGLGKIGSLPYANPTDLEGFISDCQFYTERVATVDQDFEDRSPALKSQVQEWAQPESVVKKGNLYGSNPTLLSFPTGSNMPTSQSCTKSLEGGNQDPFDQQSNHHPITGWKRAFLRRIGDWPIYSFFIAFGQILGVSSYHVSLLTGDFVQSDEKSYIMAVIYIVTSIFWWILFRSFKSLHVLVAPFALYGLAFFVLGLANHVNTEESKQCAGNIATALYAAASSSYGFYFSLNFANDRNVPIATWSFRACVIQGSQSMYLVMLWFWGSRVKSPTLHHPALARITMPLAVLIWISGGMVYVGLPDCYRQAPGQIRSFYRTVPRRKVILWFFVFVLIQNFFLALPFSHNWSYLWSSQHVPSWAVGILVLAFFIGVWAAMLALFGTLSTWHSWVLPIFAVGLGAPRWGQILWSTSNMGSWIPWAGSPLGGALIGRMLWLWLGVLDAIQGVGLGMILMQTLTRLHITFAMSTAQVLGSMASILARALAVKSCGSGSVFPNLAVEGVYGLKSLWFWIGLLLQLTACVGFFKFFRKEQLQKP
ncbi:Cell wall alpha-1,3-glucan synthase ags1 [Pseudocyphellaria aurata]|nr:Cell wall alpha-1,3-glucan synthase ags1 [Pseudocyphellaria aurata]